MIEKAVSFLKEGKILILPTETLYGICCSLTKERAVKRIYKIRKDPPSKPQLILVNSFEKAKKYGIFNKKAAELAKKFWPGPLTIIVRATNKVPKNILGKGDSIGIRAPNQPPILKIIEKLSEPIIAPSANVHGKEAPANFSEIDKEVLALVDYAIDIKNLENSVEMIGKASTIVDLTEKNIKIIRENALSKKAIVEVLGGKAK